MKATLNTTADRVMIVIEGAYNLVADLNPKKETEKAVLLNVMNTGNLEAADFWIPKSVLNIGKYDNGNEYYIMPKWFVSKTFNKLY